MPKKTTTRFPFINLEKSLERAKSLFEADARGRPMRVPDAFGFWGYSEKSSGGFQTISALKMYGLIEDSGSNEDRKVVLTKAGLRYFLDEREDERLQLVRDFALNPKLIRKLWDDWDGAPPADSLARSELKLDYGLQEQSARSLLGIYKDNLAFANLEDVIILNEAKEPEPKGSDQREQRSPPPPPPPPPPAHKGVVLMEGERELVSGILSKSAGFRLIVNGKIGVKEIERLISKLNIDKDILAEPAADEEGDGDTRSSSETF